MDNQEYLKVSKEIRNYKIARMNVLLILALTLVNIVSYLAGGGYFLFSIYTCVFSVAVGAEMKNVAVEGGLSSANAYLVGGVVLAVILLAAFFVVWLFTKKHRWAMIVLLVLFSLDCLVVFRFVFEAPVMFIDLAFHAYMLYYFILGIKAANSLQQHFPQGVKLTKEQLDEAYRLESGVDPVSGMPVSPAAPVSAEPVGYDPETGAPVYAEQNPENASALSAPARPDSPVIEEDATKKKPLFSVPYNRSQVCVKISFTNVARLIVDGKVYAREKIGAFSSSKRISAVVNGVEYVYEYRYKYPRVTHILYADGRIIADRGN